MLFRLTGGLAALAEAAVTGLVAVIVGAVFAQVVWRYALHDPLLWPEEVARYSFVWVSFLGMSLLLRRGELIAVHVLWAGASARVRRAVDAMVRLICLPLLIVLVWHGWTMMQVVEGQMTSATGWPMQWVYLSAPVSGALAILFTIEQLLAGSEDGKAEA